MTKEKVRDILLLRSKYVKQKDYWHKKLSGSVDTSTILFGFDRDGSPDPGKIDIPFPAELGAKLVTLGKGSDLSIYILLLSALKALIFRYTATGDIDVLSPVNRFTVTPGTLNDRVLIRDAVIGDKTFKELVLGVRQSVLEAYDNQDYPFDKIAEYPVGALSPDEKSTQSPSVYLCTLDSLHARGDAARINAALSFCFSRTGDFIGGSVSYAHNVCRSGEARRLAAHFSGFLAGALEDVSQRVSDILFLTQKEKTQLLEDFNLNSADFSRDRTIHHFIRHFAQTKPDTVALVFKDSELTYRELDRAAGQLATQLRKRGVCEDKLVGILLERSPQLAVAITAVWKAGGAYIPLDPDCPPQRVR
ncbi:MAG: AMP-binding protein, partial [bacterium]|nr:AMP-binding protein [bacterium]